MPLKLFIVSLKCLKTIIVIRSYTSLTHKKSFSKDTTLCSFFKMLQCFSAAAVHKHLRDLGTPYPEFPIYSNRASLFFKLRTVAYKTWQYYSHASFL